SSEAPGTTSRPCSTTSNIVVPDARTVTNSTSRIGCFPRNVEQSTAHRKGGHLSGCPPSTGPRFPYHLIQPRRLRMPLLSVPLLSIRRPESRRERQDETR